MAPRPLGWQDGWLLLRYRGRTVCLSARRLVTGQDGWPGGWWGLFFASSQVLRVVDESDGRPLLAWGEMAPDGHTCWLTHLAPVEALEGDALPRLVEYLARRAAQQGARYLAVEAPEEADFLPHLQRAGLSPLARLRLWRWSHPEDNSPPSGVPWRPLTPALLGQAQTLWYARVPAKARAVLPYPRPQGDWWVYREAQGLAWVHRGPKGLWVQLWLDPEGDAAAHQEALLALFRTWGEVVVPLWVSTLSGDGAEDRALEALGAQPGPGWLLLARPAGLPVHVPDAVPAEAAQVTPRPLHPIAPPS